MYWLFSYYYIWARRKKKLVIPCFWGIEELVESLTSVRPSPLNKALRETDVKSIFSSRSLIPHKGRLLLRSSVKRNLLPSIDSEISPHIVMAHSHMYSILTSLTRCMQIRTSILKTNDNISGNLAWKCHSKPYLGTLFLCRTGDSRYTRGFRSC
jgi:hypothetical protein